MQISGGGSSTRAQVDPQAQADARAPAARQAWMKQMQAISQAVLEAARLSQERLRALAAERRDRAERTPGGGHLFAPAHSAPATATPARAASAPVAVPAPPLGPAELEEVHQTIARATYDPAAAADWLLAHPAPEHQDTFVQTMFLYGPVAAEILNQPYRLTDAQNQAMALALGHAYDRGALTPEALQESVAIAYQGAPPGESHLGLAETLALTGHSDLITAYVRRELHLVATASETDRVHGALLALGSLPPEDLQPFLATHRDEVMAAVSLLPRTADASFSPALGRLLTGASRIEPVSPESLSLFDAAIAQIGDNRDTRAAMASFFTTHQTEVQDFYQADSGKLSLRGQERLSAFFARTLFTEPAYPGQDAFRETLMRSLTAVTTDLDRHARENPPSLAAQRDAQQLGSLVGAIEGGFHVAIEELNARNEAIEGMADLIFEGADLIPAGQFPGAGTLKGLTVDAVKRWVLDHLKEKPQDASDAIPFHALLGERIDSVALATIYDAARSEAFTNRGLGLVG